jgi:hypothetical protein
MNQKPLKKFEVDESFEPCPVMDGDELCPNGIFVFNITRLKEFILSRPDLFVPVDIDVKGEHSSFIEVNEEHMPNVELSEPVILAEIAPNSFNLIDGRHRMEKASRMGIKKIKAYKVNAIYLPDFIVIKKGYLAFVDYWNYRLKSYNKNLLKTGKK